MDTLSTQAVHGRVQRTDCGHTLDTVSGQTVDRESGQASDSPKKHTPRDVAGPVTFHLTEEKAAKTLQQNKLLAFFQGAGHCVTNLRALSQNLDIPYGTVRHVIRRLAGKGLISTQVYCQDGVQGLEVKYLGEKDATRPASKQETVDRPCGQAERTEAEQPPSIYERKKEKDHSIWNLSIEEIETLWPSAKKEGLFPGHLRQVQDAFEKQGWNQEKVDGMVAQTLRYLDWQIERGGIIDQKGEKVVDPIAYWLRAMQRNGFYQKPRDYSDPQILAMQQLAEEENALIAAEQKVQAIRDEKERLDREAALEKILDELQELGDGHPLWADIYASLNEGAKRDIDRQGKSVFASPIMRAVTRATLRQYYGLPRQTSP